jgi:hypothetical protein
MANIMTRLRRWLCGWRGHEEVVHIAATGVTEVCIRCGHESRVWYVGRPKSLN